MTIPSRLRPVAFALVFVCGLSTVPRATAVTLVGTWKGTMESQMGTVEVTLVIETASPLSGKATLGEFGGPIANGTLDNDKVSFDVTIEHGTLKFAGTVAGDEMKVTVTGTQGDKMALVARRQK